MRSPREEQIIELLNKEINLSISQFLEKIQASKATIIRSLNILLAQNVVSKEGKGKQTQYKLSPIFKLLDEVDLEKYFSISYNDRIIIEKFSDEVLDLLEREANQIFTAKEKIKLENLNNEFQRRKKQLSETIIKKEFERLTIEFSWKSSKIEGNTYSIYETETLLKSGIEAQGHSKEEAIMLINHKEALDHILNNSGEFKNIDITSIIKLHTILTNDLYIKQGIRSQLIGISGTKYRPMGNQFNIEYQLNRICNIINKTPFPPTKTLLTLVLIAYLQAFADGNKRTSRTTANALLMAYDYCPLSYGSLNEGEYNKAIVLFYEQNNLSYFKQLFIEQFEFAVGNYWL